MVEQDGAAFLRNLPFAQNVQTVDPSFSQWQLNASDVIEIIEHCLRGEIWRKEKGATGYEWVKGGSPKLNELGIQAITSEINSRVNKVVIMSNLTERTVNDILWDLSDNLAAELFLRIKDWGIDFADLNAIHDLVMTITEATVRRAMEDGERRKIYEGVKTLEQKIIQEDKTRGNIFSFIPGIGGRS